MGRGRPRKKEKAPIHNTSFSYNTEDLYPGKEAKYTGLEILTEIDRIADRERTSRSHVIMCALAEYSEVHGPGNYQTVLASYEPGGVKSDAQQEQLVVNELIKEYEKIGQPIHLRSIIQTLRKIDVSPEKIPAARERVIEQLLMREVPLIQ